MAVVEIAKDKNGPGLTPRTTGDFPRYWVGLAAAASLVGGGLLMMQGRRRAGMVIASAGTALALLDQQESLRTLWKVLPGYIDIVQRSIDFVQDTVDAVAVKRNALEHVLSHHSKAPVAVGRPR